jgi:lipopolysaccharide transport system ATP-binding protein
MISAISLESVSKTYKTYAHGWDRLWEILTYRTRAHVFQALHPLTLHIPHGQVVGIVGKNGAGKSTLLKIVAGTLNSDTGGECHISGRISALLELGSGFHPEMTGRENVYLSGAVMGLSVAEIDELYEEIVAFAEIQAFMEQPVKTYSSGMFVRLAFAVATCVNPDILIIDEALSVGDGAFSRKSFDRIMQFREAKKTILFCSHSLYQVEMICDRVLWLDKGEVQKDGNPAQVLAAYNEFLSGKESSEQTELPNVSLTSFQKTARITHVETYTKEQKGDHLDLQSSESDLTVDIEFVFDPSLPPPVAAVSIMRKDGLLVASASTHNDGHNIPPHPEGKAQVSITFPKIPLLKGNYTIYIHLICENAIHLYDQAASVVSLEVSQQGVEQGVVTLPHQWQISD